MKKIILATGNKDKAKEIKYIFGTLKLNNIELCLYTDFLGKKIDIEEDGKTLKENAVKKAKVIGDLVGLPTLSEDTGLFVDYLDGAPGVYSARYADTDPKKHTATYEDNYRKLLQELKGVPWHKRTAKFICIACLYLPKQNKCYTRKGIVEGYITFEPKGIDGFGYDPVFFYQPKGNTFAEMSFEEKNSLSHRFLAFKKIVSLIKSIHSIC